MKQKVKINNVSQTIDEPLVVRSPLLSDYLHLYLGCGMNYSSHHEPQNEKYILSVSNLKEAIEFGDSPVLRQLSSITQEEDKECSNIMFGEYAGKVKAQNIIHYEGEKVRYLLSRHFDLFGLIDNGIAIEAVSKR